MLRLVIAEPAKKTEPRRLLPATLTDPLRGAYEGATEGLAVVRSAPLDPPKTGRLARVGYGFALPLAVMRALVRDPLERKRFVFQATARMLVVVAVSALAYGRQWRKQSEAIFSPCKAVEDAPYSLFGLVLCRIFSGSPAFIYLFVPLSRSPLPTL